MGIVQNQLMSPAILPSYQVNLIPEATNAHFYNTPAENSLYIHYHIPAVPFLVESETLKGKGVGQTTSDRGGWCKTAHTSTTPTPSITLYTVSLRPTTTTVSVN